MNQNAAPPPVPPPASAPDPQAQAIAALLKLQAQSKAGATWFYWIAGLSVINSIVIMVGSQWAFIVGLGITQMIDGIAQAVAQQAGAQSAMLIKGAAFVADLLVAGVFVIFGVFAVRRQRWSYIVGMVIYALDGLLFLVVKDFLSLGFHIFALVCIYSGLQAATKLSAVERAVKARPQPPPLPAG